MTHRRTHGNPSNRTGPHSIHVIHAHHILLFLAEDIKNTRTLSTLWFSLWSLGGLAEGLLYVKGSSIYVFLYEGFFYLFIYESYSSLCLIRPFVGLNTQHWSVTTADGHKVGFLCNNWPWLCSPLEF